MINQELGKQLLEYRLFECDPETLHALDKASDEAQADAFAEHIQFGTAGLRAKMQFGIRYMNSGSVWRASQGLCKYYMKKHSVEFGKTSVVVGFDGRHNSRFFAAIATAVFLSQGFRVHLADSTTMTPMTPFTILKYGAVCGIQVTASHNRKYDNGYKVYHSNGAQIVSPIDSDVRECILSETMPWPAARALINIEQRWLNTAHPLAINIIDSLFADWSDYKHRVSELLQTSTLEDFRFKVVYTAMHGVGYKYVRDILISHLKMSEEFFCPVPEQIYPDPNFSTVEFPNPEELESSKIALELAKKVEAHLIFLNDPDADRLMLIERQKDGSYHVFSGNELGIVLAAFCIENYTQKGSLAVGASTVSTQLLEELSKQSQFQAEYYECLTGFKWLGNTLMDAAKLKNQYPAFAFEEAIGYGVCMDMVPDKDGISALVATLAYAKKLYKDDFTLKDKLTAICNEFKIYTVVRNGYFNTDDKAIMTKLANAVREKNYTQTFNNIKMTRVIDMINFVDTGSNLGQPKFPKVKENLLSMYFDNGFRLTLRNSGTEAKLKFYSEVISHESQESAKSVMEASDSLITKSLLANFNLGEPHFSA